MGQIKPIVRTSEGLERWRKQVEKALRTGGNLQDFYNIEEQIDKGYMWLFENKDAFMVVEPQTWPTCRTVHILLIGGTIDGLRALLPVVTYAAKEAGAKKMTGVCRKGFRDMIASIDWKLTQYYIEKEL